MDDILSQILDACNLAAELEKSLRLSNVPTDPHYLLGSCEEVVAAFNKAIGGLQSQNLSSYRYQMLLGEASASRLDPGAGEGSLRGTNYVQAMDLLRTPAMEEDDPYYAAAAAAAGASSVNEMNLSELPQLALDIQPTAARRMAEFVTGSSYVNNPNTDAEAFVRGGRGGEGPVAAEGRRAVDRSSSQRSSRKRKEGTVTKRVPAPRTGNTDIPPDDGYTWRKYGQKDILNSSFPRSYYRCTHKSYYGCEAKKQVQRLDEDPYVFEVTYRGTHTCQTSPTPILIPSFVPNATGSDNNDGNGNPRGPPTLMLAEAVRPPVTTSQSTSIQLRNLLEGNPRNLGTHLVPHGGAGSSSSRQGAQQLQGGRDIDGSVADLADAMFNSGSSGSSMDAIFSPREGN